MGKPAIVFRTATGERFQPCASQNGKRIEGQLVDTPTFNGTLCFNNPLGTYWDDYNQSGALVITVGEDAEVGGCDRVKVIADGNTITLDPAYSWKNIGADAIGEMAGDTNIFWFIRISPTEIEYSVKLN